MTYPHLVVATVCQQEGKVLMVKEIDNGITCWNQPAGHVEVGEDLIFAAKRETLEETGYKVNITGVMGIYQGIHTESDTHYVRVSFHGEVIEKTSNTLDDDIIEAFWVEKNDLLNGDFLLRSNLTRLTLEDLSDAPNYPLSIIKSLMSGEQSDS